MNFLEWLRQLNDFRIHAMAGKLHEKGRITAAKRKIFEVVVSREDRFGKGSIESAEPIAWLAHEHVKRASETVALLMYLEIGRSTRAPNLLPNANFFLFAIERLLADIWQKEMKKAFIYFALAKYALPVSPDNSLLQLETEMYLGIVSLAGPFDSDPEEKPAHTATSYFHTAVATAYRVLDNAYEYQACEAVEHLAEVILTFALDEKSIAIAHKLKADAESERNVRAEYANQMSMLGRAV